MHIPLTEDQRGGQEFLRGGGGKGSSDVRRTPGKGGGGILFSQEKYRPRSKVKKGGQGGVNTTVREGGATI